MAKIAGRDVNDAHVFAPYILALAGITDPSVEQVAGAYLVALGLHDLYRTAESLKG